MQQSFLIENVFVANESSSTIIWRLAGNLVKSLKVKFERFRNSRKHYRTLSERRYRWALDETKRLSLKVWITEDVLELIQRKTPVIITTSVMSIVGFIGGTLIAAQNYSLSHGIPVTVDQLMSAILLVSLFGLLFGILAGFSTLMIIDELNKQLTNNLPDLKKAWYRNEQRKATLARRIKVAAINRIQRMRNQ